MMKGNIKAPWDCGSGLNNNVGEGDLLSGFPWPPRCYTCSFCKREFRSAQALGGHMNVHRRDRARLRQSPPLPPPPPPPPPPPRKNHHGQYASTTQHQLNLNVKPPPNPAILFNNPNPNFSSTSSPHNKFPPFTPTLPPHASLPSSPSTTTSSASSASLTELKRLVNDTAIHNHFREELTKKTAKIPFGVKDSGSLKHERRCGATKQKQPEVITLDLEIGLFSKAKQELDLELRLGYS